MRALIRRLNYDILDKEGGYAASAAAEAAGAGRCVAYRSVPKTDPQKMERATR